MSDLNVQDMSFGKMVDLLNNTHRNVFTQPMSHRDLCAINANVMYGDCESRCEHRWRHWPIPSRPSACMAECRAIRDTGLESCRSMPPRARHCPYNDRPEGTQEPSAEFSSMVPLKPSPPILTVGPPGSDTEYAALMFVLLAGVGAVYYMSR